ncbi:MAG: hypothetical protein KGL19_07110 [Bacteroidota bacterium]|nr:hypothetical protein [Bacteroidota bacterium]
MKLLNKKIITLFSIVFLLAGYDGLSQDAQKGDLNISLSSFISNNKIPYVVAKVKTKIDGKFQMVSGINLNLFLDKDSAGTLIAKVVTNEKGEALAVIPPSLKNEWASTINHTFLATFDGNQKYEASKADVTVIKAKILIDTTSDRKVTATFLEMKDTAWTPVKGVELKIAVKRFDADLSVNETATFTTDSLGQASADFKRDSIPGDSKGNIILVAKVEDNDQYGNLSIEQTVPWGSKFAGENNFYKRTLFATRDKAPVWLLLMAYSIVIVVWGILFSLVDTIFKIKKLGQQIKS